MFKGDILALFTDGHESVVLTACGTGGYSREYHQHAALALQVQASLQYVKLFYYYPKQ